MSAIVEIKFEGKLFEINNIQHNRRKRNLTPLGQMTEGETPIVSKLVNIFLNIFYLKDKFLNNLDTPLCRFE